MHFVDVFERSRKLSKNCRRVFEVHVPEVVPPERIDEAFGIPLLCGLHTGVLVGFRPSDLTIRRVSSAIQSLFERNSQHVLRLDRFYGAERVSTASIGVSRTGSLGQTFARQWAPGHPAVASRVRVPAPDPGSAIRMAS